MYTLSELANYAILQPEIYAWNFYITPEALATYTATLDISNKNDMNSFWDVIIHALFGTLTWLFHQNVLTTIQYLALIDKMETATLDDLSEMFTIATSIIMLGSESSLDDLKKNIVGGVKDAMGRKGASLVKKLIKHKNAKEMDVIVAQLKNDAGKAFSELYIDKEKEYRFHKPEHYDEVHKSLEDGSGNLAVCIIGTPEPSMNFYGNKSYQEKKRLDRFIEASAPDIIIRNEQRMYRSNYIPYLLSKGISEKKIDYRYVIDAIKSFHELEKNVHEAGIDSEMTEFVANVEAKVGAIV